MDAAEAPQEGSQTGVGTFGGIALDFVHPVPIIVACPLILGVADRKVFCPALVAGELIAIQDAAGWQQC